MREFVKSIIYCLTVSFLSVLETLLLQTPLMAFVYHGFLAQVNAVSFINNVLNNSFSSDVISLFALIGQIVLTLLFIISLLIFIKKIIGVFLKNEGSLKIYYLLVFVLMILLPIFLGFLSVFIKTNLILVSLIVQGIFTIFDILIIIFSKKILPDTPEYEYRKSIFSEGF